MFTGRRFDLETGLYYYRARYYNPYIGRFLQTDPIGYSDSINWYNYCRSNPINCLDPTGLIAIVFYDGGDESGDARRESVEDFYEYVGGGLSNIFDVRTADDLGLSHSEYIIWVLDFWDELFGNFIPITDIYIFDHASSRSIQIGDESLKSGSPELEDFCAGIRDNTNSDTVIHFRGCSIATKYGNGERTFLIELATLTHRTVTGCEAGITHLGYEWIGPDYDYAGDVFKAIYFPQDGTVGVELYYDAQPMVCAYPIVGTIYVPDYITAVLDWRERPY